MEKTIDTLVDDIYQMMATKNTGKTPEEKEALIQAFEKEMGDIMRKEFMPSQGFDGRKLRLSAGGKPLRQQWYSYNGYTGEKLQPHTYIKFMYGHILESMILFLAEMAGHEVTDKQKECKVAGIKGHMDCRIDGTLVDVKSASSFAFKKFRDGTLPLNDSFGYVEQLDAYAFSEGDDEYAWLAMDKQNGNLCVLKHKANKDIEEKLQNVKESVVSPEPPPRCYEPEPDGKSGNLKLSTGCSYCAFKQHCYPELRTFLYSTGPKYLVKVVNEPKVMEVKDVEGF